MADLSHWDVATEFTADEAAALILGVDLALHGCVQITNNPVYAHMSKCYAARKRHLLPDESDGEESEVIEPAFMLSSKEMEAALNILGYDDEGPLVDWLFKDKRSAFDSQHFTRAELARWVSVVGISSKYPFIVAVDMGEQTPKPELSTKERGSLLKLIIGMAIDGYGYVPTDLKSAIPKEISDILASHAMTISDDTVRKYLKEAVETVLPQKPPKI